eukprot:m.5739 g.5739  ORF g.5739 m.5739 type:complete len:141 (+) comp2030_c0_seq1:92-514(+)
MCVCSCRAPCLGCSYDQVNAQDEFGYFPLAAAISYNHGELAELLIARGADVNLRDQDGNTAMHFCEHVETAQLLLKHGADIRAVNHEGQGVAQGAFDEELTEVVLFLVNQGAPMPRDEDAEEQPMDGQDGQDGMYDADDD